MTFPGLIIATHFRHWSSFLADGESKMEPELIIKQFGGIFSKKTSTIEVIQKTCKQGEPCLKALFFGLTSCASAPPVADLSKRQNI